MSDHPQTRPGIQNGMDPFSGAAGSRGGNVRSVQEARDLQAQQKAKRDWAGAIDEQIRRTLLETGYFHADDIDALEVPAEHCNLKGSRAAWFRNKRYMESTDVYRKVSHPAANGRKAPIYRITKLGRAQLAGHRAAGASRVEASSSTSALPEDRSPVSGDPAAGVGAGVPSSQEAEGSSFLSTPLGASSHPGELRRPQSVDPGVPAREGLRRAQICDGVDSSGDSSVATSQAAEESNPTLFDASEARERPRSAWTDAEGMAA